MTETPTLGLDAAARWQIDEVLGLLRDVLGEAVLATYLHGSAVRGGLRADSDLDLLVVTVGTTTPPERASLIAGLLATSRSPEHRERRSLEVTIVAAPSITPWRYPPPMELQYGDWWRTQFTTGNLAPWTTPNPDLAILLTAVRHEGIALFGPPAVDLIDPIPRGDLERALRDVVPELLPGIAEDDTRNSLLTLARVWFTLETGRIEPKDVAADWAIDRLGGGAGEALRRARAGYLGEAPDTWDAEAISIAQADATAMLRRIGAPSGSPGAPGA